MLTQQTPLEQSGSPLASVARPAADELIALHYQLQEGRFITRRQDTSGGVRSYSAISPGPLWNHSAWIHGSLAQFEAFLRQESAAHQHASRRPVVYLPQDIAGQKPYLDLLEAQGFEEFDREVWMAWNRGAAPSPSSDQLSIYQVSNLEQLEDFISVFYAAYSLKEPAYGAEFRRDFHHGFPNARHYISYADGRPVCIGSLIARDAAACIYNVGTAPQARKKGYAAQLMNEIISEAHRHGQSFLFLQVDRGGGAQRLYQKLGFETLFTRAGFRLKNWQAADKSRAFFDRLSEGSALSWLSDLRSKTDYPAGENPGREVAIIPSPLERRIAQTCAKLGVAEEVFLLGVWTGLLARFESGQSIVSALRAAVSASDPPAAWVLETPPLENLTAADWVKKVDERWQAARKNPPRAIPDLVREHSILETAFHYDASSTGIAHASRVFPLEAIFSPGKLTLLSAPDLFAKDTLRQTASHALSLLESMAGNPDQPLSQLEILTPPERHQLLMDWNSSPADLPNDARVDQLFEAQVERDPDAPALLSFCDNSSGIEEEINYRRLNRQANRLAHRLIDLGIGPEKIAAICLPRSPQVIAAMLAVWKAGGAVLPADPGYPPERLGFMFEDSKAAVVLTTRDLAPQLPISKARVLLIDTEDPEIKSAHEKNPGIKIPGDAAAYIIYTSGSTGKPKGVVVTHWAFAAHCVDAQRHYGLHAHDRVLQFASFNFDASLEQTFPPLMSGAALYLRKHEVWSTADFTKVLADHQLTVIDIPTGYWRQITREWVQRIPRLSLRLVIIGGEAMPPETANLWQKLGWPHVRLNNAYGPTEATITATSYDVAPFDPADFSIKRVPIGRPRAGRKIYILDPFGNPVPVGLPGELHIGGPLLAREYLNRPDLTESRFVSNPFTDAPRDRLYKTGDLARYLPDGNIDFLGRLDEQVKLRGFRIELGEIEAALCEHPAVQQAVVIVARQDKTDPRLIAYFVSAAGRKPSPKELREFLRAKLPDYMTPAVYVKLDSLPLLPSGKVDKRRLPEPPVEAKALDPQTLKGPRDPLELKIQLVFERVLNQVPVPIDASFFELGGDSLQALELIVQIERGTGRGLPLGALYQSATIEGLAQILKADAHVQEASSLVALQPNGTKPPLFFIHTTPGDILGYGNLIYHLGLDQPCYGFQSIGLVQPGAAHQTIEEMAAYYVKLLRQFQPSGPYFFTGWCYGGVIAVEMARLLLAEGERIAFLGLLETVAMPPASFNPAYVKHRLGRMLGMTPPQWLVYLRSKIRYRREFKMAKRMRFRQIDTAQSSESQAPAEKLAQLEAVYNANLEALNRYRSFHFPGKVTLYNASEKDPALIPDPLYGWVGLAQEIQVCEVPGNHDTMLAEPNVAVLATRMQEHLRQAREGKSNLS